MLIDTREKNVGPEGFSPNVQNQVINAKSSVAGLIAFILLSILTIGIISVLGELINGL